MAATPVIPVICGPTASGKSAVAIAVAQQIDGEVISADSMQIYRHLDIGTAKVTRAEQAGIPHHLIDCCEPDEAYSVARFKQEATAAIEDILRRGKRPVICGGTGLYISALVEGIDFVETKADPALREQLSQRADQEGLGQLYQELQQIDPIAAERISAHDRKRIIRALEVYQQTGITQSEHIRASREHGPGYDFQLFVLNHDREKLYERINRRVEAMFAQGLLDEAKWFYAQYPQAATASQAIGYKETIRFLNGEETLTQAKDTIAQMTRRYAKRQLTWFRRYQEAIWLNNMPTDFASAEIVSKCNISSS